LLYKIIFGAKTKKTKKHFLSQFKYEIDTASQNAFKIVFFVSIIRSVLRTQKNLIKNKAA